MRPADPSGVPGASCSSIELHRRGWCVKWARAGNSTPSLQTRWLAGFVYGGAPQPDRRQPLVLYLRVTGVEQITVRGVPQGDRARRCPVSLWTIRARLGLAWVVRCSGAQDRNLDRNWKQCVRMQGFPWSSPPNDGHSPGRGRTPASRSRVQLYGYGTRFRAAVGEGHPHIPISGNGRNSANGCG